MRYPRNELAKQMADALQGKNLFGDAPNGLFLAAPRRTGKSTFLQDDLKPELEDRGVTVIYVDFWSNPERDPGELLGEVLAKAVTSHSGLVSQITKKSRLSKITFGGLEFDLTKIGRPDGLSIPDALQHLHTTVNGQIALILDEAQHALSSDAGEASMKALKSARDQMNRLGEVQLMLVMSGSDRDKLMRLVHTGAAPFFGSQITRMPTLGSDFIEDIAVTIEQQQLALKPVDRDMLFGAFQAFGARPQLFTDALERVLSPFERTTERPEIEVLKSARRHEHDEYVQMESDYLGLRPLEQAVLWRMLEQGPRFRPYDGDSNDFYAEVVGNHVTATRVQAALESLRNRMPPMVWKSARGEYAVEDTGMHAWFKSRRDTNTWPPTDTHDNKSVNT